VFKDNK